MREARRGRFVRCEDVDAGMRDEGFRTDDSKVGEGVGDVDAVDP